MRFKAKLAPEQVSLLYHLTGCIGRLNHTKETASGPGLLMGGTVLRLDESKVRLTTKGQNDADGVSVFCELATTDGIFLEHRIQSAAPSNAIAMEVLGTSIIDGCACIILLFIFKNLRILPLLLIIDTS